MPKICNGFGSSSLLCSHLHVLVVQLFLIMRQAKKCGWMCEWRWAWGASQDKCSAQGSISSSSRRCSNFLGWNCSCQHLSSTIHGHHGFSFPPCDQQCHFGNTSSPHSLHKTLDSLGMAPLCWTHIPCACSAPSSAKQEINLNCNKDLC